MEPSLFHEPVPVFLTIMAVILIAPIFFERVRLPGIVGLIGGGILIGPYGLRLLQTDEVIILLSTIGLIYLMFSAGLEVDLHQFSRVRNKAFVFGVLTFTVPLIGGTALGVALGMDWLGAILLGSAVSSHTLIAFSIVTRLGIIRNESVSVTIGATVLTDISAFLVLAVITGIHEGGASIGRFVFLVVSLIIFAVVILVGLPRIGKEFFSRFSGQNIEFQFVLVALLITAFVAELIGLHAVVGAFLAGLAVNATLPHRSAVIGRVLFMGEAFFIPIFLIYSGMITDPLAFVSGGEVLLQGIALTAIAYLAKLIAAWGAARIFHYSSAEMWTMWGLSQAQAAVTLPTVLVGVEIGLFPPSIFSATMMMILFTSVTSPLIVQRFGEALRPTERPTSKRPNPFERILTPVVDPENQAHLLSLATILARERGGKVLPLHVALETSGVALGLHQQRRILESEILEEDSDYIHEPIARVDNSVGRGILHAAIERNATLILMGWRGKAHLRESIFGTVLDEVLWRSKVPVMVGRLKFSVNAAHRVVLVFTRDSTAHDYVDEMVEAAAIIAQAVNVPLLILAEQHYFDWVGQCVIDLKIEHPHEISPLTSTVVDEVKSRVQDEDVVVLSTTGSPQRFRSSLGKIPEELAAGTKASLVMLHYPTAGS
jgi:Kef-type K+ transport system membrane component KefB/nucleotide-binding universal stress UspA family protein